MKIAELLKSLSEARVGDVLVGGLAVQLHGYLRSTFDIDLLLAMKDENLARFIDVAKRCGMKPVIPVDIDALRDARQIEQWHREKGMLAFALREPMSCANFLFRCGCKTRRWHGRVVRGCGKSLRRLNRKPGLRCCVSPGEQAVAHAMVWGQAL
jgi:hypothetical protein